MLDVNAGIPLADEPALLAKAIQLVQSVTDVPLSIDSSIVEALEAGCAVYQGKPLINSVTGEDEQMERVLPLVKKYGAAVVAISNDETGISEDPDVRFEVARKIVNRAADHGIPASDVVVDPLVMPIGALGQAGQQVFRLLRRLQTELAVNTTCGASNVSFGLPERHAITGTFLAMAISNGMTSAIMNPLHDEVKKAVKAADVLAGHDQDCAHLDRDVPRGRRCERCRRWRRRRADAAAAEPRRGLTESTTHRVVFAPSGLSVTVTDGTTVLDAARQAGADLDSTCGGRGLCGRCQIVPSIGSFSKWQIDVDDRVDHRLDIDRTRLRRTTTDRSRVNGSAVRRRCAATSSSRSRRPARCTGRSCASRSTSATSRSIRSFGCTTSSCRAGRARRRRRRPTRADRGVADR